MVYFKLVLVALMWGGTFIATKMASQVFEPFTGAALRYFSALIFMVPMMLWQDRNAFQISKKQFFQLLLLGGTGIFIYSFFFFNGMRLVPASHGSLIVALNPVLVMLISTLFTGERIRGIRILGLLISLCGTAVVISRGDITELFTMFSWGDAFMLGCPVSWAFYTFFAKDVLKTMSPLQASTWATMLGFAMILLLVPFETHPQSVGWDIWLAILYLGIAGSVLGIVWYYEGVKKIGPVKTAAFNNLIPVFAMTLSVLLLDETIHGYTIYGSVLVIGGVYTINRF